MTTIVVHGPQGCGKTRNADALRKAFGCTRVVEADEVRDGHIDAKFSHHTLVLTSDPEFLRGKGGSIHYEYADAIKRVPQGERK